MNTTDSAVRITHEPTGIVVSCQNEKSQLQNREQAMRILRARLLAAKQEQADQEASDARRSQVRTVDRSERIRTYNFAENRISDHRVGYKAYNLDQVLDGDLDAVVQACVEADTGAKLSKVDRMTLMGTIRGRGSEWVESLVTAVSASDTDADRAVVLPRRGTTPKRSPPICLGTDRSELWRFLNGAVPVGYDDLVNRRCARIPLQHLTGTAHFRTISLSVGPGVFIPRPETELVVEAALALLDRDSTPSTGRGRSVRGSGPIAVSVAVERPQTQVHAVEADPGAIPWLKSNAARGSCHTSTRPTSRPASLIWTVKSTWSSPIRRTSPRTQFPETWKWLATTPRWPCTRGVTGSIHMRMVEKVAPVGF